LAAIEYCAEVVLFIFRDKTGVYWIAKSISTQGQTCVGEFAQMPVARFKRLEHSFEMVGFFSRLILVVSVIVLGSLFLWLPQEDVSTYSMVLLTFGGACVLLMMFAFLIPAVYMTTHAKLMKFEASDCVDKLTFNIQACMLSVSVTLLLVFLSRYYFDPGAALPIPDIIAAVAVCVFLYRCWLVSRF
jgi:hypothetical protein